MRIATLALGISLLSATTAQALDCPSGVGYGSVPVGTTCVDKYEASVWSVPNPTTTNATLVSKLKDGTVTLQNLEDGGATQLGCIPNYDPFPSNFPANGNWTPIVGSTPGVYAASVAGVLPSACITWFQAQQACVLSDKRLPTNAEWQAAAAGTPDPGNADDGLETCKTTLTPDSPVPTGSRTSCESNWGAFDMVGNVWEWVADWVPFSNACPGWGVFSDDRMCLSGASTTTTGPGALIRGGGHYNGGASPYGLQAGVFALDADEKPNQSSLNNGFRCAR